MTVPIVEYMNRKQVERIIQTLLPKAAQYATAATINDLVVEGRTVSKFVIADEMQSRSKSFLNKSLWYQKTRGSLPIYAQSGFFGSRAIPRSTGWIEQITGGQDKRKRKWSSKARPGGKGQVYQKYRFKPENKVITIKRRKYNQLIKQIADERHFDKPVLIGRNKYGINPGVFKFLRSRDRETGLFKMVRLSYVKKRRVRKVDIFRRSWALMVAANRPGERFKDNMIFQLFKLKRKV